MTHKTIWHVDDNGRLIAAQSNTNPNNTDDIPKSIRDRLIALIAEVNGTDWRADDIADAIIAEYNLAPPEPEAHHDR